VHAVIETSRRADLLEQRTAVETTRKVVRSAVVGLGLLWSLGALAFLLEASRALRVLEERDYGEGILMWQAQHVTDLKTAYHSIANYPYVIFHYPPVFHILSRAAALLTGNLLVGGRLVSILSFLGSCVLLAIIAGHALAGYRDRASKMLGSIGAGLLGFTSAVMPWACLFRVDLVAVFFTLLGLMFFITSPGRPGRAFAAFVFFVIAVYTKQTMVAAPLVCLLSAWLEDRKLAWRILLFSTGLGASVLAVLCVASNGWFATNLFRYNQNPYTFHHLATQWESHIRATFVIPLIASFVVIWMACARGMARKRGVLLTLRQGLRRNQLHRCILIVAGYLTVALLTTIMLGKEGSNYNYFIEVDFAIALLSGLFLGSVANLATFRPAKYATALFLALAAFVFQALPNIDALQFTRNRLALPSSDSQLASYVSTISGPIYGENMVVLVNAGKEIAAEPAIITSLAKNGMWDQTDFVQSIRNHRFSAIQVGTSLDNRERFTQEVAAAIRAEYPETVQVAQSTIYLPRM